MNSIIVLLIMTITIPLLLYVGSIVILRQFFHKTGEEAKKTVDDVLSKIISMLKQTPPNNVVYPVLIGSNGIGIVDSIIYSHFQKMNDYFENWYYETVSYPTSNVVCYEFRAFDCRIKDKKLLLYRTRQLTEKALLFYWHDIGVYNLKPDNFVATRYCVDTLRIYIACNDAGFNEIQQIRRKPM